MKIELKLKIPETPNFIFIEDSPALRQEGFKELPKVSIADLTTSQLEEVADEWKANLINKANKLKAAR